MQIIDVRSDAQFTYVTITMAHGLSRKFRVGRRNGTVQIALTPPHRPPTWHCLRPETAETIRSALKVRQRSRPLSEAA